MTLHFTNNINQYLDRLCGEQCSQLGFFSKPHRAEIEGTKVIIKRYHPIKKEVSHIIKSHDEYIHSLRSMGIQVPWTKILAVRKKSKNELVIIQKAFEEEEVLRTMFSQDSLEDLYRYLTLVYDEIIKYWNTKPFSLEFGFHPTLRNYSIRNNSLYYFDTFPPMNMPQPELNKLILQMAPVRDWIKSFIPSKAINRVSNEYYYFDKMFLGIVGSSVRLRPEFGQQILDFTENYLSDAKLSPEVKKELLAQVTAPPKLSFLWRFVRKLTGNIGKPNVKLPNNK
ncbi:MAG: DUF6206 family protein [Flavobacteriaceae bacterium]